VALAGGVHQQGNAGYLAVLALGVCSPASLEPRTHRRFVAS